MDRNAVNAARSKAILKHGRKAARPIALSRQAVRGVLEMPSVAQRNAAPSSATSSSIA